MKQAKVKKINYNGKTNQVNSNDEVSKLIKIVLIIVVLFIVFYVITIFVTRDKETENLETPTSIQYDKILIGDMLNQNESSYYVLITRKEDEYVNLYATYLTIYESKENAMKYYTADLDDVFNQSFIAEEANTDVTTLKNLKLNSTALVKIDNKKITSIYNDKDEIVAKLEEMIK